MQFFQNVAISSEWKGFLKSKGTGIDFESEWPSAPKWVTMSGGDALDSRWSGAFVSSLVASGQNLGSQQQFDIFYGFVSII